MSKTPKTKTYPNAKAALAGVRASARRGEISKTDAARASKQIEQAKSAKPVKW